MTRRAFTFGTLSLCVALPAMAAEPLTGRLTATELGGGRVRLAFTVENRGDAAVSVMTGRGSGPGGQLDVWAEVDGKLVPLAIEYGPEQMRDMMSRALPRPVFREVQPGKSLLASTWEVRWDGTGTLVALASVQTDAGEVKASLSDDPSNS